MKHFTGITILSNSFEEKPPRIRSSSVNETKWSFKMFLLVHVYNRNLTRANSRRVKAGVCHMGILNKGTSYNTGHLVAPNLVRGRLYVHVAKLQETNGRASYRSGLGPQICVLYHG